MGGVGGMRFHHVSWPSMGEELVLRGHLLQDVTVSASLDGHFGVATGLDVSDLHVWMPSAGALWDKARDVQECLRIQPGLGHSRCSVGLDVKRTAAGSWCGTSNPV